MITIARYSFPYKAHIAKAKLESEGIVAFIADEHTINAQWIYSDALGGVRLQVPAKDTELALKVLEIDCSKQLEAEIPIDLRRCPACGSTSLEHFTKGKRMAFLIFAFLHFPLWPFRRKLKCRNCRSILDD